MSTDAVADTPPLVDHHCHGVFPADLEDERLEDSLSEAYAPAPPGTDHWDKPVALSLRRWCAPLLDLEPFCAPADYAARRRAIGAAEVNRRFPGYRLPPDWLAIHQPDAGYLRCEAAITAHVRNAK